MTRPRDACPYPRPFPVGFEACPAYQAAPLIALTMRYRPLPAVWTCSHLTVRAMAIGQQRFYPRCRLGDEAGRRRWVADVDAVRLGSIRRLQAEMNAATAARLEELWAAKARQLQARSAGDDLGDSTAELRRLGQVYAREANAFLERRARLLEQLHLPLDACRELLEAMLDAWIEQPDAEPPEIPSPVLERFPEDVRVFLRPIEAA
ncbi:MAG: hypothetical protein E6J14_12840 [Chloroflexi bacterium]|nr:MAG: hypothetical protein E6J14_12840 [Chloroflexota bacterium]